MASTASKLETGRAVDKTVPRPPGPCNWTGTYSLGTLIGQYYPIYDFYHIPFLVPALILNCKPINTLNENQFNNHRPSVFPFHGRLWRENGERTGRVQC